MKGETVPASPTGQTSGTPVRRDRAGMALAAAATLGHLFFAAGYGIFRDELFTSPTRSTWTGATSTIRR